MQVIFISFYTDFPAILSSSIYDLRKYLESIIMSFITVSLPSDHDWEIPLKGFKDSNYPLGFWVEAKEARNLIVGVGVWFFLCHCAVAKQPCLNAHLPKNFAGNVSLKAISLFIFF